MNREPVLDPSGLARAAQRMASIIPGYSGYKNRERLREEDRAVRDAVVRQLGLTLGRLERALGATVRSLEPAEVEAADQALRALGRDRDRIRFAPAGYASLFARKKIQSHELDGLLALDAQLWAALEALDRAAGEWDDAAGRGEGKWPGREIEAAIRELEDVLDERESTLRS
jgi:hypothetical protein